MQLHNVEKYCCKSFLGKCKQLVVFYCAINEAIAPNKGRYNTNKDGGGMATGSRPALAHGVKVSRQFSDTKHKASEKRNHAAIPHVSTHPFI